MLVRFRVYVSPDKSHVLKAGQSQQLCTSPSPNESPTPSLDSSCPQRALQASITSQSWLPSQTSCPESWFLSSAHRSRFTSWPEHPHQPCHRAPTAGNLGSSPERSGGLGGQQENPGLPGAFGGGGLIPALAARQTMPACPLDRKTHAGCLPWGVSRREI